MEMTIRPMTGHDKETVLAMMRTFYASPAVFTNGSEEIFRSDIDACVGDNPFLEGYIFQGQDAILGYAMVAKSFSTEFGKPCIWIEDLYVAPPFRRCGIGKGFFAFITAKHPGCIFRLEVEQENESAVALYRSCGFTELPYLEMKK